MTSGLSRQSVRSGTARRDRHRRAVRGERMPVPDGGCAAHASSSATDLGIPVVRTTNYPRQNGSQEQFAKFRESETTSSASAISRDNPQREAAAAARRNVDMMPPIASRLAARPAQHLPRHQPRPAIAIGSGASSPAPPRRRPSRRLPRRPRRGRAAEQRAAPL